MLTRTNTQILESLRDSANNALWQEFDARYRPVLTAFARRRGLSDEDAAEAAQTTLAQFVADYQQGRYDRTRGRLSSWIIGIANHRIADLRKSAHRRMISRGESAIDGAVGGAGGDERADWDDSVQKVILERAMAALHHGTRLEERTLRAFDLCAMRGVPAEAAAEQCGMTVAEVYVAKNRVIKKLREIVSQMTEEFDDP
ncbi:MAG: sigma-70 family RNA polymerase sigma factor [Phycisphaerales bacterium]|nr:sigma-70 family RNA polymerase sigma factor [Phycisphaerales bacterium]